jgi:hypothetical protein
MRSAIRSVVLGLAGAALAMGLAEAAPRRPAAPDPALTTLRDAATECFAQGIRGHKRAMTLAKEGRWYEAAGVSAFLCRPEVDAMIRRHDELHGFGSGGRYFTGPYVRTLERALAARIRPVLEATAGTAEPREDAAP